jgi:hypothetical protein
MMMMMSDDAIARSSALADSCDRLVGTAGVPMIEHHIRACAAVENLREIFLIGFFEPAAINAAIQPLQREMNGKGITLSYLSEYVPLGSGGAIYHFRDRILRYAFPVCLQTAPHLDAATVAVALLMRLSCCTVTCASLARSASSSININCTLRRTAPFLDTRWERIGFPASARPR